MRPNLVRRNRKELVRHEYDSTCALGKLCRY